MIEQNLMNIREKLSQSVELADFAATSAAISSTIRTEAQAAFLKLGIPNIKHEEWRFTNLRPYLKGEMQIDNFSKEECPDILKISDLLSLHAEEIQSKLKGESKGVYKLVLHNGTIVEELSNLPEKNQVHISYLSELSEEEKAKCQPGSVADYQSNHFVALNTALVTDGLSIRVLTGQQLDKPIHIIRIYDVQTDTFFNERSFVYLEKNAEADIIETYLVHPESKEKIITNSVYEFFLDNNAFCKHYDIQKTAENYHNINRTEVHQSKHSEYSNYVFTLPGGALFRNNLVINIEDEGTHCHLYGLYLTDENQLVDNHTEVHHKFPHCESNQLYKGVMQDESRAVFNGKIYVYEDAQKTNAFQQSDNLLLSENAGVNAKPQLEIFADDVKCSHGTTVGQIDQDAIFYLRARGIGEHTAKKIMVNAFAFDVTQKVQNTAIRQYLEEQISQSIF